MRILSRKSVELMSADHLGDMRRGVDFLGAGYGFGLTVAVSRGVGRTGAAGSAGEYFWGGAAGTRFWIDPKEQMIGIFMIQILPHNNLTYGTHSGNWPIRQSRTSGRLERLMFVKMTTEWRVN